MSVSVSVCPRVSVCGSITSHISKTSEVIAIIIKFDRVTQTASVMRMHHMPFILTVTFIHGHTDLNHENNI